MPAAPPASPAAGTAADPTAGATRNPAAGCDATRGAPFAAYAPPIPGSSSWGEALAALHRAPEPELLPGLLEQARLDARQAQASHALALRLAARLREHTPVIGRAGLVQGLLQQFALSSQEGVALMCLAEALLRIPDVATRDALIRDKIAGGQWQAHLGQSPSLFVNAATWGLLLTGKLVATHSEAGLGAALARLSARGGEPLIRKGVDLAMRMLGEQFVSGETIEDALRRARPREAEGFRHSYDMLGEAALTAHDAERYFADYERAVRAIGAASGGRGVTTGPGISIKLSALHPRYARSQLQRVVEELQPRILHLALLARRYDIGLNLDAEESDRLELSLALLQHLCREPQLADWNGMGFVVQAYQKRAPAVIDAVIALARASGHRLMLRLVKGAYWDSEIKRAQIDGLEGYPVYTRKAYTDVCYLACARRLLAAPDAVFPQFATHNAQTLAAVHELADPARWTPQQYEFQCLHGMGEALYEQVVRPAAAGGLGRPCRIYAPVGTHETLLAYLVRRLLENGANTSFVNRIADRSIALERLVEDPVQAVEQMAAREGALGLPHPAIPLPRDLYGGVRCNSRGLDLASEAELGRLGDALRASAAIEWRAAPLLAGTTAAAHEPSQDVCNPADRGDVVGRVREASAVEVDLSLREACAAAPAWAATPPDERAAALERAAAALEDDAPRLMGLMMREAGKTSANALGEVREAADFLRYYAASVRRDFANATHAPLGPVVCISPWNFPLAIFTGQIAAALAAGNVVLAKPAEQTPLVAAAAVQRLWQAGVPPGALQLLPGRGETVGARLVADARVQGVLFTGSTEVARLLQRTLAERLDARGRPVTLVAETGGQNAMIVDSSALPEQVVADVVTSAFDSAGQRCSALRVLCVQEDGAERLVAMLEGAMAELVVGNPDRLATDVGPVIDAEAAAAIERHIDAMRKRGRRVQQPAWCGAEQTDCGSFVAPTLIEIESIAELQREVFGPVLHLLRWRREDLGRLIRDINATGYGLTFGLHTRIDETVARVIDDAHAGNVYVNRNMIGAVVGVQPFGGEGLSGTGPKAGGPLYLDRLLARRPDDVMARALGDGAAAPERAPALMALQAWAEAHERAALAAACEHFGELAHSGAEHTLRGPTGEKNVYRLEPRAAVLCLADSEADRLLQLAAVLAVASRAIWPESAAALRAALPPAVQACIALEAGGVATQRRFDAVLHHGGDDALRETCRRVAQRPGPIVGVIGLAPGEADVPLERLVVERSLSINTAAAGGNASLMTIG